MEVIFSLDDVSIIRLALLYAFMAIGALYTLRRFGYNKLTIFIVLIYWEGLFNFVATISFFDYNYFKILVFIYAVLFFGPSVFGIKCKTDKYINIFFVLFSICFWISFYLNEQSFITVASQYGKKYSIPFLFYHGIKDISNNSKKGHYIARLLVFIIFLQVFFSIAKVLAIGSITETLVGSLQYIGGGTAVVIPILGFFIIYLTKQGNFKRKDWWAVFSLLIISIVSAKRAPVFIFPLFILGILVFLKQNVKIIPLLFYLLIILILFYVGIRTNYTLNPDGKVGGSFNIQYAIDYSIKYYFGTDEFKLNGEHTSGYGSSIFLIFRPHSFNFQNIISLIFGRGLEDVVTKKYGRFYGDDYGYDFEGLVSYPIEHIYMLGYASFIFYLFFAFSIIGLIKNKKFRNLVLVFYLWEFFFYRNVTLTSNSMAILLVFICMYSNMTFLNMEIMPKIINEKKISI